MPVLAFSSLSNTLLIISLCTVSKNVQMFQECQVGVTCQLLRVLHFVMVQLGVIIRQEYLFVFLFVLIIQLLSGLTMGQVINQ
jgi:hypothetical protein